MKPEQHNLPTWEVERIKARIEKAKRRIAAGYAPPDKRGETEEARLKRLELILRRETHPEEAAEV